MNGAAGPAEAPVAGTASRSGPASATRPTTTDGHGTARRLRVGVLGASGYGGVALIERLLRHAGVELRSLGSRAYEGKPVAAAWPQFAGLLESLRFSSTEAVIADSDVVFMATPHGATAPLVKQALDAGKAVIDLSADFRLPLEDYRRWYGAEHPHPELYPLARYGLVELHRDELPGCRLVASPGCNATAANLALAPLAAVGLLARGSVAAILTGVSGAGRAPAQALHFAEVNENAKPYKVAGTHRHTAEIEATLGRARGMGKRLRTHAPFEPLPLTFNPHLVPMSRGILASCTTPSPSAEALAAAAAAAAPFSGTVASRLEQGTVDDDTLLELYAAFYDEDPMVHVQGELPQTKAVATSDRAIVSVRADARNGTLSAFCVIDNLGKGAAGQAVQAFNIAFAFPETEGLTLGGSWP